MLVSELRPETACPGASRPSRPPELEGGRARVASRIAGKRFSGPPVGQLDRPGTASEPAGAPLRLAAPMHRRDPTTHATPTGARQATICRALRYDEQGPQMGW
jgi:hypothetical protein